MRFHAFRIKNFRSIVDTGFQELSPDGITLIVGQNESGKSSILEGIHAFETGKIVEDDIRSSGLMPEITCIFKFNDFNELEECIEENFQLPDGFKKIFDNLNGCISLMLTWKVNEYDEGELLLENLEMQNFWRSISDDTQKNKIEDSNSESSEDNTKNILTEDEFINQIFDNLPFIDMFEENSLLPPTIDLDDLINKNDKAIGYEGAKNFLLIADIKPEDLNNSSNTRIIEDNLEEKNKKVNNDIQKYWHQTVGKADKIQVLLELKYHKNTIAGKEGKPYLAFWIRDKNGKLSPTQRSRGVKWFISFYLKLEATALASSKRIFLIDEPGSNLHAKAQEDILQVLEKQKNDLQIVFTTHSPYLVDMDKVYRVLAVERVNTEDDKSATQVLSFQKLGSASVDTLLPLYTKMGVDISHQSIISKENNVLLEEISAFFYLKAFWKLFKKEQIVNFLPATGCPNLPLLANLMLGWGLSFSVVIDDDSHGRKIFKELKDSNVCDVSRLIKITDCHGIEDLFSSTDFASLLLSDPKLKIKTNNSEFMKDQKISKVITARNFMISVDQNSIKLTDLSVDSRDAIEELLTKIINTLKPMSSFVEAINQN